MCIYVNNLSQHVHLRGIILQKNDKNAEKISAEMARNSNKT